MVGSSAVPPIPGSSERRPAADRLCRDRADVDLEDDYPYLGRKSFGSYMIAEGHDVVTVADWMGNEPETVLRYYAKKLKEIKRDGVKFNLADAVKAAREARTRPA
jgi:hypothetical protein